MTDKTESKERAGRFTKKPVTIDAWLIDFVNKPLPDWVNEAFRTEAIDWCPAGEGLYINTLEGHMLGTNGSWLIKGVQGELYACKPDIFAATYERASLAASAGSEPVAYAMFADNGNIRLWSKARIPHPDAKPLYLHPSPPEGMVEGWIASKDQMPPPGVRVFWGDVDSNRVGYDSWAGDDYRWTPSHWMHIPEFPAPPTTSAGSKGE